MPMSVIAAIRTTSTMGKDEATGRLPVTPKLRKMKNFETLYD